MSKITNKKLRFRDLRFPISNLFRISDFGFRAFRQQGFTLLFAVLVGSLLFAMGIAIANLAIKEVVLSVAGKSSETAFFAADTGTECALYWDFKDKKFFLEKKGGKETESIRCNGTSAILKFPYIDKDAATTTFSLDLTHKGKAACVEVTVGKVAEKGNDLERTVIESRGRNDTDCGQADAPENPGRVERALRVRY